jgi:hypothetical protein
VTSFWSPGLSGTTVGCGSVLLGGSYWRESRSRIALLGENIYLLNSINKPSDIQDPLVSLLLVVPLWYDSWTRYPPRQFSAIPDHPLNHPVKANHLPFALALALDHPLSHPPVVAHSAIERMVLVGIRGRGAKSCQG